MAKRIDFPAEIEELRIKYKVNKTNMQKFLNSCGSLPVVEAYLPLIVAEYEVDHDATTETVGSLVVPAINVAHEDEKKPESEKVFRGFHPITGEEVFR